MALYIIYKESMLSTLQTLQNVKHLHINIADMHRKTCLMQPPVI